MRRIEHARRNDDDDDGGDEQVAVATHSVAHHREPRPIETCRLLRGALRRLHVHVRHARQDVALQASVLERNSNVQPILQQARVDVGQGLGEAFRRAALHHERIADGVHSEQQHLARDLNLTKREYN